jgi:hypothetical protein
MVIALSAVVYHVTKVVFGEPAEQAPAPAFPVTYLGALVVSFVPVLALGFSLPAGLQHLLRLAAAAMGR